MASRRRVSALDDAAAWRPDPNRRTSILFDVYVLGQQARALVSEAMRDAGLRPDEYAAYSVVFEAGSVTLTELAAALAMPVTTAADVVRAMADRGHVRRRPHPTDRRASLLSLTPEGLRAHRRASRAFEGAHRALLAELGSLDEASTRQVLQALSGSAGRALGALRSLEAGRAG